MLPDRVRVQHMIDATRQAVEFTSGRSRTDLDADAMLALALTRLLEILGEAAKHVSPVTRALAPELPWRQITGTRDRIAHGYFEINLDLVWRIVSAELPALQIELERLVARMDGARTHDSGGLREQRFVDHLDRSKRRPAQAR